MNTPPLTPPARSLKNILIYIGLADFDDDEEYTSKVAQIPEEIQQLIETGFEYICQQTPVTSVAARISFSHSNRLV